jgi:hypothetical protein
LKVGRTLNTSELANDLVGFLLELRNKLLDLLLFSRWTNYR